MRVPVVQSADLRDGNDLVQFWHYGALRDGGRRLGSVESSRRGEQLGNPG